MSNFIEKYVADTRRKISIMAAYCDGKKIEGCQDETDWFEVLVPVWDWAHCQYRVVGATSEECGEDR